MPNLKGTKASLSYVRYFLYLVSSLINISIFHITCWIPSGQTSYSACYVLAIAFLKTLNI